MRILFVFFILSLPYLVQGQNFTVDTILQSGDIDRHINFVILPDGYREEELPRFKEDVNKFVEVFFNTPPFSFYKSYFNVFTINIPSLESGADHPGTATDVSEPEHQVEDVDNYFGSTFDFFGIHRLLVPLEGAKIYEALAINFPSYDQVIILVNTPHYGGSGGQFATASLHTASIEVTTHELGHSFAGLADEYYAGDSYAGEKVNMTMETDPLKVRWKNWVGENEVGIYQHCCGGNSANWYRPHQNCKMRVLGAPFCPICTETIIERIHELAPPLLAYTPESIELTNEDLPLLFSLDLIYPQPNTLQVIWELNNAVINDTADHIIIQPDSLISGDNYLIAYVMDTTPLIRTEAHDQLHIYTVLWTIQNEDLATGVIGNRDFIGLNIYPNPAGEFLKVDVKGGASFDLSLELLDVSGRIVDTISIPSDDVEEISIEKYDRGTYYIRVYAGRTLLGTRSIVLH